MEVKKSVVAAITTAISYYMQAEQQAAIAGMEEAPRAPEMPRPVFSAWVMAGRQAAMETRRMWQMRLVR